jgi:hypothetical protein
MSSSGHATFRAHIRQVADTFECPEEQEAFGGKAHVGYPDLAFPNEAGFNRRLAHAILVFKEALC